VIWAANLCPPSFVIATVTAATGLLRDEEADVMARMVGRVKTTGTKDAAIV
jgi:hypothetical protein